MELSPGGHKVILSFHLALVKCNMKLMDPTVSCFLQEVGLGLSYEILEYGQTSPRHRRNNIAIIVINII